MQTIEEYKEYAKQLEGEVKQWHDAFDASQAQVKELTKENLRLERERVEQNSIIETCANELEELRMHEVEWDLAKARIKELEKSQRWRKCSEELPENGAEVLATDGEEIWLCHKDTVCDGSPWFQPDGLPHIEGVTHWKPLPSAPKEANK